MTNARHSKETPKWGTPPSYVEMARIALGGRIELDPMSEATFNKTVLAERYYTEEDDCFRRDWRCSSMLLNPAGGLVVRAWQRLVSEWSNGHVRRAVWIGFSVEQLALLADEPLHPMDFSLLITRKRIDFLTTDLKPNGRPSHSNYVVALGVEASVFEQAFLGRGRFQHGRLALAKISAGDRPHGASVLA
jgi:hypothetical protein